MGTLAYRASSSAITAAGTDTIAVPYPAGVVDGDGLRMDVTTNSNVAYTLYGPSGWTKKEERVAGNQKFTVFTKQASSEPANTALTTSANAVWGVTMTAVSDTDNNCIVGATGSQLNASSVNATAPSVTVANSGSVLTFGCGAWNAGGVAVTATPPAGMTEAQDVSGGGTYRAMVEAAYLNSVAAGATGTKVATLSAAQANAAALVAFTSGGPKNGADPLFMGNNF